MQTKKFAGRRRAGAGALAALLALFAALVIAGCGGSDDSKTTASTTPANSSGGTTTTADTANASPITPAFTGEELFAPAGDNWFTNGGGTTNDRFSPLDEINTSNVSSLRGDWMTHLNGSGAANKYSAEGQPLEYNGTIYIPTGADDVFAVDAASGRIKWVYRANMPDSLASVICCGWDNRGVALGDGKIYSGQLDGTLVALDQETGRLEWETHLARPRDGYTITAAPLYADGKVIIGPSGAEYGVRGRMDAYDADTGRLAWRFYTIPAPGEPGSDTWPQDNDEWKHGGATTWNTPTFDPSLGLIYFSTSNAGNDYDGSKRAGDNLYAASIVALNINDGTLKWAYQQVHHDLWDFDSPSPTVLIDAPVNGRTVHGIAEPSKNGYVFFLDRATGRPVFPIRETPVYQDAFQKTAKTQPIPSMEPFAMTRVDGRTLRVLQASVASQGTRGNPIRLVPGSIYSGVGVLRGPITVTAPSAAGGDNWPPSSYNPESHMYYVCSQNSAQGFQIRPQKFRNGSTYTGSTIFAFAGFNAPGNLTAYDMTTGRIAWRQAFPDACYSGAVSTGGDLVFVGRNRGELDAYDGRTGDRLWSFQTGAGANSTASVYQVDGREKIGFYSGGNALNGSPHGDNLWQFSLDGTMGPAAAPGTGEAIEHAGDNQRAADRRGGGGGARRAAADDNSNAAGGTAGDAAAGRDVFAGNCSVCHGLDGTGGNGGPDLTRIPAAHTMDGVVRQVTNGGGGMPAFGGQLSDREIQDVAAYVSGVLTR